MGLSPLPRCRLAAFRQAKEESRARYEAFPVGYDIFNCSVFVDRPVEPAGLLAGAARKPKSPAAEPKTTSTEPAKSTESVKPAEPAKPAEKPTETPAEKPAEKAAAPAAKPAENVVPDAPTMPPAPKVSEFAPADDLDREVDLIPEGSRQHRGQRGGLQGCRRRVDQQGGQRRQALVVIALSLGLHDGESKYKPHAGALMKAAQALADTKDYESAKKGVAAVRAAAEGKGEANVELKWQKVASLPALMKEVPLINTKLKRMVKPALFQKRAKDTAGFTAAIAAIAQARCPTSRRPRRLSRSSSGTRSRRPWRDHAASVNAAIHKGDEPAAAEGMKKLAQSCDDCHNVFHKEALEKTDKE